MVVAVTKTGTLEHSCSSSCCWRAIYTAMVILGVLACIWCQQLHGERRQVGGKGAGKGRNYSNREMDEWYGNDVANIHYSDEEAMPTPRLRRRRTTGSSSQGSGDGRTTLPAYSQADGPPVQDPEREPFNLWRSPDEFEEDDMPAIPEDYVPTPSTPDHWVLMSTRIQERRDRAEDALHGGKGKGKEKGKEKGGREIFRPGQGRDFARPRPLLRVCVAEESQEETSVASTPGTADVTPDEEEEVDPAIPFPHGAKAPPAAWMQGQRPPGRPQGPFPQQQGLQGPQATQQGPIGPQPQHEPQGAALRLRAARHHRPFMLRLLPMMNLMGATRQSQLASQVCQMMGHGGVSQTKYPGRPSSQPLLARSIM